MFLLLITSGATIAVFAGGLGLIDDVFISLTRIGGNSLDLVPVFNGLLPLINELATSRGIQ